MNKIASIYYLMEKGIPTLDIDIIDRISIEKDVSLAYKQRDPNEELEWVIRSGEMPDKDKSLERGMPWTRNIFSSKDAILKIKEYYSKLSNDHLVFMHPQRDFAKSGSMLILESFFSDKIVVEGVTNWPEPLTHGRVCPEAIYYFGAPWYLRSKPVEIKGNKDLFNVNDFIELNKVENVINHPDYSFFRPTTIEFSFNKWGELSIHDINCY